jgi:predicted NBD/HSP70 family sugar kinase
MDAPLRSNERLVVQMLRRHEALSRSELARLTALPKTTVAGVVGQLLRRGVLVERADERNGRPGRSGRPASVVAIATPAGSVGVLALSRGALRVAVTGFDGQLHASRTMPLAELPGGDAAIDAGVAALAELAARAAPLGAAVMGIPMPYDRRRDAVAPVPPDTLNRLRRAHAPWLLDEPRRRLAERLGVPVLVENDANLGALGEATFGAGKGLDSLIHVKLAEGIGAGVIIGGRIHRGSRGLAGELAHVRVRDDGELCVCGGRGCIVTVFNGPGIVRVIQPAFAEPLTFADVIALAVEREPAVVRILSELGRTIGRVLADLSILLDPEGIVLDGMLYGAAEPVIAGIREMLDRYCAPMLADGVAVRPGALGDRAELLGAIALARDELLPGG